MARQEKVVIRLEKHIKEQVQDFADKYGLTMSGLIAYIVGDWLDKQTRLSDEVKKVLQDIVSEKTAV